jgi:hypothetical protein
LLRVDYEDGNLVARENVDWDEECCGVLQTIFIDGDARNIQTLAQIRERVEAEL